MDSAIALEIGRDAVIVFLKISLPIMLAALVVGLVISLFQALTQIQEPTLSFVPKIIAIFAVLIIFLPYIGNQLSNFSESIASKIVGEKPAQSSSSPESQPKGE